MQLVKPVLGTMTFGESVFAPDVEQFIDAFLEFGEDEIDTAYVYNDGECEKLIGEALLNRNGYKIATKVNPRITGRLDGNAALMQLNESLQRLGVKCVNILYLHFPDPSTPVESVLKACNELHKQGKFMELGLSNFPAWMVADVWHICNENGWIKPTVYEGIYNPLTRNAEKELYSALKYFGMRFYAYNPLAGGLLSGKYETFDDKPVDGRFVNRPNYQNRYWKRCFFDAMIFLKEALKEYDIPLVEAVFRWMVHHSMLDGNNGDKIIIGASKLHHLKENLSYFRKEPLPDKIIEAFDKAWIICKADSPEYFTLYNSLRK